MESNLPDIYSGVNIGMTFTGNIVRVLVGLLLFAIVFYAFMLILKFRILKDTVEISTNNVDKLVITINLVVSLIGSVLAFILILV
jgi:hypothetical protein